MKKTLLITLMLPLFVLSQQKVEIKDGRFYTYVQDGRGKDVNISFSLSEDAKERILKSESYAATKKDSQFIRGNLEKRGITDTLALHLMSKVNGAVSSTGFKIKNRTSLTIEENSKGMIYCSGDEVAISFPFQGQNGRGNMIYAQSITKDRETFIIED